MELENYNNNYYFQDGHVRLRCVKEEDWIENYNDSFNTQNIIYSGCRVQLPPSVTNLQKKFKDFSERANDSNYLTIENYDGQTVGIIDMYDIDEQNGTFWMYPKIYDKYKGKGYASAAMKLMLRYAFFELRLNRYNADIVSDNVASIKLHEKLGCTCEGVCKENIYFNGEYHSEVFYGLLKRDFIALYGEY